jgi:glycosyltransferase involved in cell wall biosynthesis
MRVAAVHNLPTGGAVRVMVEWLARTSAEDLTVYTRDAKVHEFAPLPERARIVERPLRSGGRAIDESLRLALSPRAGAQMAGEIDAAGHDVVFCFASALTQAIDVLPFLGTPSLFYAPEALRSAYEPADLLEIGGGWRGTITRMGINPIEARRRQLDRRYVRSAPHIVTHSAFTQGVLREIYGVDSEVVRLGVDANLFTPGTQPRDGYVLSVGALHPLKGHALVIEALSTIPPPRPPLVMIGDRGDSGGALRALADELEVDLDIRAKLPLGEVVDSYRRAGVVACAQIREPFGLVPLEAMACATPVVAVEEGGFRETVSHGQTGLLVPRDPRSLGTAIARVLHDRALASQLGEAGRAAVERAWTWEQTTAGFDRLLAQLAEKTNPPNAGS